MKPDLELPERYSWTNWSLPAGIEESLSADVLNAGCHCVAVDDAALSSALESELGSPQMLQLVRERCPHVFSARPVFVSRRRMGDMARIVKAVESVVSLPAYREHVLARSPGIARHVPGPRGVFFGYDFHVSESSLGLIEVNTNAGGAMLNAILARAHRACCAAVQGLGPSLTMAQAFERAIVEMFLEEWRLGGLPRPLHTIAIVDEAPAGQYLYPEFLLFQGLFERHGLRALIVDPGELQLRGEELYAGDTRIDLVYNRLTDFYLDAPQSQALRCAYLAGSVVLTPHPHGHALYADKRNLALWTDAGELGALGANEDTQRVLLTGVPRTVVVDASNADALWADRKGLFFKPFAGYGSRATYRGDKVTQRVWSEIMAGGYVAQALVNPGARSIDAAEDKPLKFDLREYVYNGRVQWSAARLYQGQTTNFRTPGGGFAPVYAGPT